MKRRHLPDIKKTGWMSLDNAAKIYPSNISSELSQVFRIGCRLKQPVNLKALQKAVAETCKRFPYYQTTLRRGFFWYFLQYDNTLCPPIVAEEGRPCIAFPARHGRTILFRIVVHGKRLSAEFLHILTDGGGALEFFRTLIVTYLRHLDIDIPYSLDIIDPKTEPQKSETEDSFNKYFNKNVPVPARLENAWHLPYEKAGRDALNTTCMEIDLNEIKPISKSLNITITEFLVSVYLFCLKSVYLAAGSKGSPVIRVEVPVNMRKSYPSKTMRNFSLFVMPEIDLRLGDYSFEEIIRVVHNYMQLETDPKVMSRVLKRNVKPERNIFIRIMPVFIKDMVLSTAYKKHGPSQYSGVLTNVGIVRMPEEAKKYVDSFHIIPPPPLKDLKINCGVMSYEDKMIITFGNITNNTEIERKFSAFLIKYGINVKMINNKI